MESDDTVSGEFQRSTRMPLDAVVRLHFQGTVAYQNGFAANVSATGMFVKHPSPPPLGSQLVFEFNLGADRKPVQGAGEVVWVRDRYIGPGQPAGVGIRFLQLDTQSRDHIAEALFEYLEQSLAEDSLLDSSGFSYVSEAPATEAAQPSSSPPHEPTGTASTGALHFDDEPLGSGASSGPTPQAAAAAEPFDFASLAKLPPRHAPPAASAASAALATSPPAPDARRPFSVFSSLDQADSQTADIVREALREETPPPTLAAAAAAAREPAAPRWRMLLLLLVLVGAGGTLAWRQWGANLLGEGAGKTPAAPTAPAAAPAATTGRRPEPLTAAPAPGTTLAQQVGVDAQAISPAAAPPRAGVTTAPPEEPSDVAAAAETAPTAAGPGDRSPAAGPPTAASAPPRPPAGEIAAPAVAPPLAATASAAAGAARAAQLVRIDWSAAGDSSGQTALVLAGDGAFLTGAFSYSEIGGDNPRVLIKLKGMQNPYRGPAPRGGGNLVRGVRTGFHVTTTGNEIHVVVDLARGGVKVVSLAPSASDATALTLRLAP